MTSLSPSPSLPSNTAATGSLGPFPTPTHGQPGAGSFTIACSAHIKASPRTCLEVLLKAAEYPSWNRYCRKCIIDEQPDEGGAAQAKDNKKSKSKKKKDKKDKDKPFKPKAGKPREPVDIPIPVPETGTGTGGESQSQPATATATGAGELSTTNTHSSSGTGTSSSLFSDPRSLPDLSGPEFLRLGTKFTFHVHMDPFSEDSSPRNTALEVSRLERIDEVVEADVAEVKGTKASLPSAGGTGSVTAAAAAAAADTETTAAQKRSSSEGSGEGSSSTAAAAPPPVEADTTVDNDPSATEYTSEKEDKSPTDAKEKGKEKEKDKAAASSSSPENENENKNQNKLQLRRTGFRIAWKTRPSLFMPNWMLHSERVQEFVEVYPPFAADDEPETAYQCWETFYGVLAPVVRTAVGASIIKGFDVWMDGLKKRAEGVEGRERE